MFLILCFLYFFFAVVLGTYLGMELISVRRADRMARTLLKAAAESARIESAPPLPEAGAPASEPNYFTMK